MDEKNYEDILKRRQERWKDEKKRRRRKVLFIYGGILVAVLAAGILGYGFWKSRHGAVPENVYDGESTAEESSKAQADEGVVSSG